MQREEPCRHWQGMFWVSWKPSDQTKAVAFEHASNIAIIYHPKQQEKEVSGIAKNKDNFLKET